MVDTVQGALVMVVDDNFMNLELLEAILTRHRHRVITVAEAERAFDITLNKQPEIILLDVNMPIISGYDVCKQLKAEPRTADIPVIFISALNDTPNIIEGFNAGGVDYISKPFKAREVIARVTAHLLLYRQRREIAALHQRERQQYERMDQLRKQFIGSATKDLKNPLFVISGYADMLTMMPEIVSNERSQYFVDSIQRGVDKMSGLVREMIDLLQLETQYNLKLETVDFGDFLEMSVEAHHAAATEKNITLTLIPADEPATLLADLRQIGRVMDQLLANALAFTLTGGAVAVRGKVGHKMAIIEVADTGIGIPKELQQNIFSPFVRVNSEEHHPMQGSGLGLAIVKTIVEQHGGRVMVMSNDEGSTFSVMLPLHRD